MGRLDNKIAVITGASSGIGEAAALEFAKQGAKVVLAARDEEKLGAIAGRISEAGGEALTVRTDVSVSEDVKKLMKAAVDAYGRIDVLVNCAGILDQGLNPIDRFLDEDLEKVLDTNTKGALYAMREASSVMARQEDLASIVNVSSVSGVIGNGGAAYVASKGALIGATKHAGYRFAGTNIRCNAICPGMVITPMTMSIDSSKLDPDMIGTLKCHSDMTVAPSMPEDVANILVFFASDESKTITGQVIVCDGGSTL